MPCGATVPWSALFPPTPEQWVAAEKRLSLDMAILLYQHGAHTPAGLNPMPGLGSPTR
jgi:hypothetical protein